jgi:5-methyltetrahydrofolate--homocysteine methyltransferase
MKSFLDFISKNVAIFDGAMGTSIQKKGTANIDFQGKECVEYINLLQPTFIQEIHDDFLRAGADVLETNTFGALRYLLAEYGISEQADAINKAAVRLALEVTSGYTDRYVSGSIGPGTKLPSLSQITFPQLYHDYYSQAECLISEGVHLIQIETGQDPLQMKIALKAVLDAKGKLKKNIPIFMQATLQENGQMLVGTDLLTFIHTFRDMPIHGLGINCGTGPHHIENYVRILSENCHKYISILPNAGLPVMLDGQMSYDLSPDQFAQTCADLVKKYRIHAIGGCCGTTHDYISALARSVAQLSVGTHTHYPSPIQEGLCTIPHLTSIYSSQLIKNTPPPLIIGERANVNGSKRFRNLLSENKWDEMVELCLAQQDDGAHVIDINLTQLDRNESDDFAHLIPLLNKTLHVPLMIDSTSFLSIETALRHISGRAIVNSTNFEHGDAETIKFISMCRDMNAALICLTIDEDGMAKTFEHKIKIVERFITLCEKYHFPKRHIFIDCLTFALSTGNSEYKDAGKETIATIRYITEKYPYIHTILGVSNVSFGLKPKIRKILNSTFLAECVANGLTAAIVDSAKILPIHQIPKNELALCLDLIYNRTEKSDPLTQLVNLDIKDTDTHETTAIETLSHRDQLYQSVIKGRSTSIAENITELIKSTPPLSIINDTLIVAMQEVGSLFASGKMQLPFVLKSAEIMKKSVDILKPHMTDQNTQKPTTMLLATVTGDVHDIGKNLVQIIVENNGFPVIDIGVKQTPQQIYNAIVEHRPHCLGLSALLIKSTEYMRETLLFLKSKGIDIPVICGGAALNADFVKHQLQPIYDGKVDYGKDAFSGLKFIASL